MRSHERLRLPPIETQEVVRRLTQSCIMISKSNNCPLCGARVTGTPGVSSGSWPRTPKVALRSWLDSIVTSSGPPWPLEKPVGLVTVNCGRGLWAGYPVGRAGEQERRREIGVRAADHREEPAIGEAVPRVVGVHDPHRRGGHAARLQRHTLVADRRRGRAHAQAAVHPMRRVLDLERRVIRESRVQAYAGDGAAVAAVVQVNPL